MCSIPRVSRPGILGYSRIFPTSSSYVPYPKSWLSWTIRMSQDIPYTSTLYVQYPKSRLSWDVRTPQNIPYIHPMSSIPNLSLEYSLHPPCISLQYPILGCAGLILGHPSIFPASTSIPTLSCSWDVKTFQDIHYIHPHLGSIPSLGCPGMLGHPRIFTTSTSITRLWMLGHSRIFTTSTPSVQYPKSRLSWVARTSQDIPYIHPCICAVAQVSAVPTPQDIPYIHSIYMCSIPSLRYPRMLGHPMIFPTSTPFEQYSYSQLSWDVWKSQDIPYIHPYVLYPKSRLFRTVGTSQDIPYIHSIYDIMCSIPSLSYPGMLGHPRIFPISTPYVQYPKSQLSRDVRTSHDIPYIHPYVLYPKSRLFRTVRISQDILYIHSIYMCSIPSLSCPGMLEHPMIFPTSTPSE